MKISAQWLKKISSLNLDSAKIAEQLTMAGIEVSSITSVAKKFSKVVIGEVLSVAAHPNAERLHLCVVNVGESEPLNIVCGAPNVKTGLKVPVALVGAHLEDLEIKKAKLRGVESYGMICSTTELGLSETSEGIMVLPDDAKVGMDFRKYLELDDEIIEAEIMPNRGDCLSALGLARELAAINSCSYPKIDITKFKSSKDSIRIKILAHDACPHYVGCIVKGINVNVDTPIYLKELLRRSNIRSINPVVDIANYVMLELGQPLHMFDLAKIEKNICVRYANHNEKLILLDGKEVELDDKTLVIADAKKTLAIAGIMGGADSAVDLNTKDIFIESAFFTPTKLRGCARRYGLQTDASFRFERGVDPELQLSALNRAVNLLTEIVGGKPGKIVDEKVSTFLPKSPVIVLRKNKIKKILGVDLDNKKVKLILEHLGMKVKKNTSGWKVKPPSFRFDLEIEEDLIEELARIFGYQNIAEQKITGNLQVNKWFSLERRRLCEFLVDLGYREIITYSFIDPELQTLLDSHVPLPLINPISSELSVMRTNLWTGLIKTLQSNQSHKHFRMKLFELGLCFIKEEGKELEQQPVIAGLLASNPYPEQWGLKAKPVDFFDVKNDVENLLKSIGQNNVSFRPNDHKVLHPKRSAKIYVRNKYVGDIGELHPKTSQILEISFKTCLFSINLSLLNNELHDTIKVINKMPPMIRDLAIVVDKIIIWEDLKKEIVAIGGKLLKNSEVFDVYQDENLGLEKKSIAIHLTFQSSSTLTEVEVESIMGKIVSALTEKFNAKLRG